MTALVVLGALALALLAPLLVTAIRQRTLASMAMRNIGRRRAEAALIVAGALLGTAIITSSLVVGDVIEGSFADAARTRYGPVDLTLTSVEGGNLDDIVAAVEAARIQEIDGLLRVVTATASLEAPASTTAVPQSRIMELDLDAARAFGSDPRITGVAEADALDRGEILLHTRTAEQLGVAAGDPLRLHAFGARIELVIAEVTPEIGLVGYGGAIVAPGTIVRIADASTVEAVPAQDRLLVSLDGGVFDTRELSDAASEDLRAAVAEIPGVQVEAPKAGVLDDAARDGAGLSELFSVIGLFSVLAGILLLINLFVMLAEERKTELGMLRAVGFTRRRLTRVFAIEGAIYAIAASVFGAVVGLGIGWLTAIVAGSIFGEAEQASSYPLVIEPVSLGIGATVGLVISMVTIWATSLRIARLNIIRAIRDLPEPTVVRARTRTLVLGSIGIVVGLAAGFAGWQGDSAIPLLLGVPVAAFSAGPMLRRLLPERPARTVGAGTVLAWGLAVYPLFPEIMGSSDMIVFVVQGVVLTVGAVSLAASLDRVWSFAVEHIGRGRGLAPRLGIAYPLAHRFRTSMLLGMFSLVIFTVTILTSFSVAFDRNNDATVGQVSAGFDVLLDTNPANPVDAVTLAARDDIASVAGLARGVANFGAPHLDGTRDWPISGFDADLIERGTPTLFRRDPTYATDAEVYRAVLDDPTLAIVPENFLVAGVDTAALDVGGTFTVVEPESGRSRELTIAGLGEADWLDNGALVSRELTGDLFGARDIVTRFYIAVAQGADPGAVAASANSAYLTQGAEARTFTTLRSEGTNQLTGFLAMLRGFLGFGLLVGIAGLGVVMVRAVRERRQEIGMLRAIGFRAGLIRTAMLSEAGLIAVQGTLIGAALGLITTRQLLSASESFGDVPIPFIVPWAGLAVIVALPLVASLAATAWPASRAAAIRPAIALRIAD